MNEQPDLTIGEASRIVGVSKQAVYLAIKYGKLKAYKRGYQWFIKLADLDLYQKEKYSRKNSKKANGELLHDNAKGEYSVTQLAKIAECSPMRIYYLIRNGFLKEFRYRTAHIVLVEGPLSTLKERIEKMYQVKKPRA